MIRVPLRRIINGKRTAFAYALVDYQDGDLVANHYWHRSSTGYAVATVGRKHLYMHRLILDAHHDVMVDHIDGNKLNNQRRNLRICTNSENMRNKLELKANKSGHRGVCRKKGHWKWTATIKVNTKNVHLGYFAKKEEAIAARIAAEQKYFGDFAPVNLKAAQ